MRLAINIGLSLVMLALCLWLVWPDAKAQADLSHALGTLTLSEFLPYLLGYLGLLAVTHFCRAWRWNNLLAPIGVKLPPGRLLAISSVGFMAILALPARLGEFVRPALIRKKGEVSASAALGTVAVERIIDGLMVSLLVFASFFPLRGTEFAKSWMMPTAWAAFGIFASAMVFLGFAIKWPKQTVRFSIRLTLARYYAPRLAHVLSDKLHSMISGFLVLKDKRNLIVFTLWTLVYWSANGLSVWVLAQGVGLELSLQGAFATMGLVAVGISLPNSPGLVGQFQWFTTLGLSLYMPEAIANSRGLMFAILLHGIQVIWYVGAGALALATPYVSLHEVWSSRSDTDDDDDDEPPSTDDLPAQTKEA